MPVYDFKCKTCGNMSIDVVLPITHTKDQAPRCCGDRMGYHISSVPSVLWKDPNIEPFRAVATPDRPVITSTRQHREYMARNNLVDANDLFDAPTQESERETLRQINESIEAITPSGQVADEMRRRGMDTVIDE